MEDYRRRDHRDHRESWGGWISNKVASAEAALSTAFASENPARSHSLQNLRAVAKAARLAKENRSAPILEDDDQPVPSITRRASAIDITLSQAWGAVRRAATAAISSFDQPVQSDDEPGLHSAILPLDRAPQEHPSIHTQSQRDPPVSMNGSRSGVSSTADSDDFSEHQRTRYEKGEATTEKVSWDIETEISDVTQNTCLAYPDFSHDTGDRLPHSPECSSSTEWEDVRNSATSFNLDREQVEGVLTECDDGISNVAEDGEDARDSDSESECGYNICSEKVNETIDMFNTMFERNGGTECVSRVKEIGDSSLAGMRNGVELIGAVKQEVKDAKLKLDKTLERVDSAARTKVGEIYWENGEASDAAESVIAETRKNKSWMDVERRNTSLLRDCSGLLAVFATKICGCILEKVEGDKESFTWSERVEDMGSVCSRGISELRIISKRFGDAIVEGHTEFKELDSCKDFVVLTGKMGDMAVDHVVECMALAVTSLQIEMAERAYQCCS